MILLNSLVKHFESEKLIRFYTPITDGNLGRERKSLGYDKFHYRTVKIKSIDIILSKFTQDYAMESFICCVADAIISSDIFEFYSYVYFTIVRNYICFIKSLL